MKTTFSRQQIEQFLKDECQAAPGSISQLAEGHISQAFSFTVANDQKQVLRIADRPDDFYADKFVYEKFGKQLPVPKLIKVGEFIDGAYFCIAEFITGIPSNQLSEAEFKAALPSSDKIFAKLFHTDISHSSGYGHIDYTTGNGKYSSWKECLEHRFEMSTAELKINATNIGINPDLVDAFTKQYQDNLKYASETRRLSHGDLGFDNTLINDGKLTAILDWAGVGYAEWMYDYAKLDFWWPGRYTDAKDFGEKYGLETNNLVERRALYFARSALSTIHWADENGVAGIAEWLRTYVKDRLLV